MIWRSRISFPSVYIITDHILTINKQYEHTEVDRDSAGASFAVAFSIPFTSTYKVHSQDWHCHTVTAGRRATVSVAGESWHFFSTG